MSSATDLPKTEVKMLIGVCFPSFFPQHSHNYFILFCFVFCFLIQSNPTEGLEVAARALPCGPLAPQLTSSTSPPYKILENINILSVSDVRQGGCAGRPYRASVPMVRRVNMEGLTREEWKRCEGAFGPTAGCLSSPPRGQMAAIVPHPLSLVHFPFIFFLLSPSDRRSNQTLNSCGFFCLLLAM